MTRSIFSISVLAAAAALGCSSEDDTSGDETLPATSNSAQSTAGSSTNGSSSGASTGGVNGAASDDTAAPGGDTSQAPGNGTAAMPSSGAGGANTLGGSGGSGGSEGVGGAGGASETGGAGGESGAGGALGNADDDSSSDDSLSDDGGGDAPASDDSDAGAGDDGAGGAAGGGDAGAQPDEMEVEGPSSTCIGDAWPTANPTSAGPFQVAADKEVGPLAGVVPDPIYGDQQQRFNVYRPQNLADSGYCHPILIWANGYRDNPEQKPPDCVVDSGSNQWCGQYSPLLNHLASHGFVVVASLSTATAEGDPLPTIAGLDWILEQAEDPSSPYYNRLDTDNIGQLGHSYGGMSTCMSASEPRYKALATICGTSALSGVHTPMLFYCGGQDSTVSCSGVRNTYQTVTDQPAFFLNELGADHGSWVYEGAGGVSLSSAAAWFRVHLMDDTENRRFFYGPDCVFCNDNRVQAEQNSLMTQ